MMANLPQWFLNKILSYPYSLIFNVFSNYNRFQKISLLDNKFYASYLTIAEQ